MSCDVGKATEGLENELWRRWSDWKGGPTFRFPYVTWRAAHGRSVPIYDLDSMCEEEVHMESSVALIRHRIRDVKIWREEYYPLYRGRRFRIANIETIEFIVFLNQEKFALFHSAQKNARKLICLFLTDVYCTRCKGNKCHHLNSRRGRLKGPNIQCVHMNHYR